MKIIFENAYVKVNGVDVEKYDLNEGERIELLFFDGDRYVPDYAYLKNGELRLSKCKAIKNEDRYLVFPPEKENYVVYQSETTGYSFSFLVSIFFDGRYVLVAENEGNCRFIALDGKPENVESGVIGNGCLFVKYSIEDLTFFRIYEPTAMNEIGFLKGQKIDIVGNSIKVEYHPRDVLSRTIRAEYEVFAGNMRRVDYVVECARAHIYTEELIPLLFLQALVCEDAQASEYLSNDLKAHFAELKGFLGEFDEIIPFENYYELVGKSKRFFVFQVENRLIVNVSELE
ncbi:MAG: hypothetical protein IJS93_01620 [Clostridia bacterium]|nr:hypothetical protein [Clostridia bacterium]